MGKDWNLNKYGSVDAPRVKVNNLKQLNVELDIWMGGNDILSTDTDLQFMEQYLNK